MMTGAAFLRSVVAAFSSAIHAILTDNGLPGTRSVGIAFADQPRYRFGPTARFRGHAFDRVCREHGIEHRRPSPITYGPMAKPSG